MLDIRAMSLSMTSCCPVSSVMSCVSHSIYSEHYTVVLSDLSTAQLVQILVILELDRLDYLSGDFLVYPIPLIGLLVDP